LLCFIIFISNSWMILLRVLEITIIMLMFLRLQPLRRDRLLLFRYFMYQSLARMCLISFFLGMLRIHLVWVILLIKLILPPFHVWLLMRIKFVDRKTFYWVMIVIKFPVFLMFMMIIVFFSRGVWENFNFNILEKQNFFDSFMEKQKSYLFFNKVFFFAHFMKNFKVVSEKKYLFLLLFSLLLSFVQLNCRIVWEVWIFVV